MPVESRASGIVDVQKPPLKSPFTYKGLLIGALFSLFVGIGGPYGMIVVQGSWWGVNASSPEVIFLFFISTFFINVLLSLIRRQFALSRADLVLLYAMLLMAVTVPMQSFLVYLIPMICVPYYSASPENNWTELFHPYIPPWIVPQDFKAIKYLYEGLPQGESIPWEAWVEPLGAWFAFFLILSFMMICLSVILHRQWSVHERLTYPMAQLPLQMISEGEEPLARIRPFFKNKGMWLGFVLPFALFSLSGLHHYFPAVPEFRFFWDSWWWFRHTVWLVFAFSFAWVGFFYLVNLDITFSIWFFYLLCKVEEGTFNILGIASSEKLSQYEYSQPADLSHQGAGAVLVFVLYGLWAARDHLRAVFRKAWTPDTGIDDVEEVLSYRVAVLGWLGSLLFIGIWLWRSGIPLVVLPLFLFICLIFYILVTRAVTAGGVPTARPPIVSPYFVISGLGTSILGTKGLVALTFTFVWQAEMRLFPMIACANALKLAEIVRGPKRRLFWGMMLALLCSLAGSTWMIMTMGYAYGGINLASPFLSNGNNWIYNEHTMLNPTPPNVRGWVFTGIGGIVEGLLMWAQHRWFWWPLHPLGFAIGVGWLTGHIWFSALVAWGLKLVILQYGGARLYGGLKPFFLGLILGEATVAGTWLGIDALTGMTGNFITAM